VESSNSLKIQKICLIHGFLKGHFDHNLTTIHVILPWAVIMPHQL